MVEGRLHSESHLDLAHVIETEFGPTLQDAGIEIVIVDNDRKVHSKTTREAFAKFGIRVWPGAGIVGDRKMIADFTGKTVDDLGGFPVNSPDCMPLDQSVNNTWKNNEGGLYSTFRKRKPSRQTNGRFINDMLKTWDELSQDAIRNAIDLQPKVMQAIINAKGGPTSYMNSGFAKS